MILTLYYMYATLLQWWRLEMLRNKLSGTLNSSNALLVCDESVIFETKRCKSIENLLFRKENRFGVTVIPKQRVNLCSQWLYFPRDSRYFPIFYKQNKITIYSPNIYILVQAVLDKYKKHQAEILPIENFGELVAWKVTDYFEAILKTDMHKLSQLVHCFSQMNCDINHEMQLLRIETIDIDGRAKRIAYERQYSAETAQKYSLAPVHWNNFVKEVKDLYSKIRDATNPKITIDNGTPKPEELKVVPVSEVKPIKKDKKNLEEKNTLEVNCSDYRRHRSTDHSREHRSREHKRHKQREESETGRQHKTEREQEQKNDVNPESIDELESFNKDEVVEQVVVIASKSLTEGIDSGKERKSGHKHREKHKHKKTDHEESQPGTSGASGQKSTEKLKKGNRTSSKEKKLVRASATCDEPHEDDKGQDHSGSHLEINDEELSPTECNGVGINKRARLNVKPPNVLVYADSTVAKENVKDVLAAILNGHKYTIYDLPTSGPSIWRDSTALVVICGSVDPKLTSSLMKFLLNGGQLLCLCSDLLYSVLYTFTTAEVREHELVRFSYGKWKNVKMMHHIFCYQASPAKKQFSKDSDTSNHSSGNGSSPIAPRTPSTVEIQHGGRDYTIQVQVLGAEETWQTPSLLLATVNGSEGRAVFSQVHLEIDPSEYVDDENKFEALRESNQVRLDILKDLLVNHLNMDCETATETPQFTPAYFLGRHDLKLTTLNETHCIKDYEMKAGDMHILFCGKDDRYDEPSRTFLPILIHVCPQNFNTLSYFDTLDTKYIGRLVIYSDVLTSSHTLLQHNQLTHGVAVICRQQLGGVGRSKNKWISPSGGAFVSLQIHIPNITNLGKSQGLVQHLIMVAVVKAIKRLTGNNKDIKLGIKWPNDLYINNSVKVGGAMVNATVLGEMSSLNIGCGINLSNSNPTTCINDVIRDVNNRTGSNIPEITLEKYMAQVFNETEKLINRFQIGDVDYFYDYYYEYWLHNDASVTITTKDGKLLKANVAGIDDHGYLKVRTSNGFVESVQPDGNSFDLMKGLIYPKVL
ncbi:biotin--protein ligase [Euwallacea similis]|uniref:biotin--protein ligase n=1 Tax=Euwallacea similis TaxID=1736056 RepID=UPI00344D2B5F